MSSKRKGTDRQAPIDWAAVLQNPATPKHDPADDGQRLVDAVCQRTQLDPSVVEASLELLHDGIIQELIEGKVVDLGDFGCFSLVSCSPDEASGVDNAGDEDVFEDADHNLYRIHFEPGEAFSKVEETFIARLARRN